MNSVTQNVSLLPLLQLVSPTLPIGAYAYSTGLEYAIRANWVNDYASARNWIAELAAHNICHLDLPILRRLYVAWSNDDLASVLKWSRILSASRETAELLAEDQHMGIALARLMSDLGVERTRDWKDSFDSNWATLFSLAACHWNISEDDMQTGYLWAWCEHQVAVAIKLVPLGQTDGQKILLDLHDHIPHLVERSRTVCDAAIGQTSPALAIGSALHEQQYSRLFRS